MSTPAQIISDVRRFTHVNVSQYSDVDALRDLNKVKDELWNKIVYKGFSGNYNWDIWADSTVALQSEYPLLLPTGTVAGQKTLNSISLNYDGETYPTTGKLVYTKATEVDKKSLHSDWNYYEVNQDKSSPIYYQKDNSIFIAPVPTVGRADGIKVEGIRKIADYTLATTETETRIPVEFHYILELGLMPYAQLSKGMDTNEVNNSRLLYQNESAKTVTQISQRMETGAIFAYPYEAPCDSIME